MRMMVIPVMMKGCWSGEDDVSWMWSLCQSRCGGFSHEDFTDLKDGSPSPPQVKPLPFVLGSLPLRRRTCKRRSPVSPDLRFLHLVLSLPSSVTPCPLLVDTTVSILKFWSYFLPDQRVQRRGRCDFLLTLFLFFKVDGKGREKDCVHVCTHVRVRILCVVNV